MVETKQQTFLQAYKACHESFVRYCSAMAYGKMDAEDLVQDVLLSAFQNFEKLRQPQQLKHYLIRAARNRSISNWRKKRYKAELLEQHAERLLAQNVSPETLLDIDIMYRLLDELPVKQKEALILFEINGFSMKEIAEIQKSSVGAIKTKISRGRKLLRRMAEHNTPSPARIFGPLKTIAL